MMWWNDGWGWWWVFMPLGMLAFWSAVVWVVVTVVRGHFVAPAAHQPDRAPEQLLAERFARGEIDDDEYRRRLDTLHDLRTPVGDRR